MCEKCEKIKELLPEEVQTFNSLDFLIRETKALQSLVRVAITTFDRDLYDPNEFDVEELKLSISSILDRCSINICEVVRHFNKLSSKSSEVAHLIEEMY